jgi:hypothetical protein
MLQTASIVLAILVAVGTLKGRESDKNTNLVKMQMDIEYIKEKVGCMDTLKERITIGEASTRSGHKRLDEHLADHGKGRD